VKSQSPTSPEFGLGWAAVGAHPAGTAAASRLSRRQPSARAPPARRRRVLRRALASTSAGRSPAGGVDATAAPEDGGEAGEKAAAVSRVSDAEIEAAAKIIAKGRVVAFTGAGVSAESGVPTYRDPGGLWRKYDMKKVSEIKSFLRDPIACWRFELELYRLLQNVGPNAGHRALAELEAQGLLLGVVTQNVEGLHTSAGSRNVIELHGNETRAVCIRCSAKCSAVEVFRSLGWLDGDGRILEEALPDVSAILRKEAGDDSSSSSSASPVLAPLLLPAARGRRTSPSASARSSSSPSSSSSSGSPEPWRGEKSPPAPAGAPVCPNCGLGLLKPDAVYFGEKLDTPTLRNAERLFASGYVALVIGSTCRVAPASILPVALRKRGGRLIDVNPVGSRVSKIADCWLKGPSADVLPRLVQAVAVLRASAAEDAGAATADPSGAVASE